MFHSSRRLVITLPKFRIGSVRASTGLLLLIAITTATGTPVKAQAVRHTTIISAPRMVQNRTVVVDRGRPGWWRGHPAFAYYHGPRHGYYFAPGFGYYPVAPRYVNVVWRVGGTLPVSMRNYVVLNPAGFGLAVAPAGHVWCYAGTNFVLIARTSGVIVQSVAGGW